ncbi:alpha/beta hydrolase [Longimycelium tulufanense]|uniref:Alpha/beta hydrolase n=1 Tax=Longimycelium tulufanense TaxID=907463 RepID=A0A8J3FUD7_9PSEU|nr:alpha/beta fold hydrolase [Longimycelium tulufanense]GGM34012.1 alpha/beta hydrolase [Longimycelium tulufanense]
MRGEAQTLYGKLCVPTGGASTVQLLIPGATYNSTYWDPPATPGVHNFRASMNQAGYATLTVDRLGTGRSSKPLSLKLSALGQAEVMHQAVQKLRSGELGPKFEKVIIGGHSLGSLISILEAATYQDVDGVLITGIAHKLAVVDVLKDGFGSMYPATLDGQLAERGVLDPGYLTTRPGTRGNAFHWPGKATDAALKLDEATKDVFATTEAADGLGVALLTPYTRKIAAPVYLVMGGHDRLFCGPLGVDCSSAQTLLRDEAPFYSPEARLQAYLLPGKYGHSFNYAPNAYQYHQAVVHWADTMVGR